MNTLKQIDPLHVDLLWPEAEPFLRQALAGVDPDEYLKDMKARIFAGINKLWAIEDADGKAVAYAATITYTPDGISSTIQIYLASTISKELFTEQLAHFEAFAMQNNITYIEIVGRKGWEKVMKPHGFVFNYTSLLKRVTKELH